MDQKLIVPLEEEEILHKLHNMRRAGIDITEVISQVIREFDLVEEDEEQSALY